MTETLERPPVAAKSAAPRRTPAEPRRAKNMFRDTAMQLRVSRDVRDLIDAAAQSLGKTRTEFVLDSARQQALDVLLDQRFFRLNAAQAAAFEALLNDPPAPNANLRKLMKSKAPWEK